jgi:hypothetical protein
MANPSRIGAAILVTALAILVSPAAAGAQTATDPDVGPPGIVQSGTRDSGGSGGSNGSNSGGGGSAGAGTTTTPSGGSGSSPRASAGGKLPLTGYPMTAAAIVIFFMLSGGLLLRRLLPALGRPSLRP